MAKKPTAPKAPKAAEEKPPVLGAGQYRATCAFSYKLDRIERDAVLTLTAEQAAELGSNVMPIAPQRVQESDQDKEQGQSAASDEDGAGASTAGDASGEQAANQDQVV